MDIIAQYLPPDGEPARTPFSGHRIIARPGEIEGTSTAELILLRPDGESREPAGWLVAEGTPEQAAEKILEMLRKKNPGAREVIAPSRGHPLLNPWRVSAAIPNDPE